MPDDSFEAKLQQLKDHLASNQGSAPNEGYRYQNLPLREDGQGGLHLAWPQAAVDTGHALGKMGNALGSAFGASYAPQDVMPTNQDAALIAGLAMTGAGGFAAAPRVGAGLARAAEIVGDYGQSVGRQLAYPSESAVLRPEIADQYNELIGKLSKGRDTINSRGAEIRTKENALGGRLGNDTGVISPDEQNYLEALRVQAARKDLAPVDPLFSNPKEAAPVGMVAAESGNIPLPMDKASRMARAQELGYTTPTFHGAARGFEGTALKPSWHSGDNVEFYSTPDKSLAQWYGDTNKPMSMLLKTDNYLDTTQPGWRDKIPNWPNLRRKYSDVNDIARESGFDGIITGASKGGDRTEVVSFNPSTVRSTKAAFDPARVNENNILAANPPQAAAAGTLPAAGDDFDSKLAALKAHLSK